MKKEITPELIRESTIAHLEALASFGVKNSLKSRQVIPATVFTAQSTTLPEPALPITATSTSEPKLTGKFSTPADIQTLKNLASLEEIKDYIGPCERCKLCKTRTNIVFGTGNPKASLMFVGEGPGADEDAQGIPFVGRAGQLLTKMIEAMGFKRDDVYIANIVKCRPPENRNPENDEVSACIPFVKRQIEVVNPKAIVCLGKIATQTLLNTEIPISKLRGRFQEYQGYQVMPTYHPAFLLRSPQMKKFTWEDLQQVMKLISN